MAYNNETIFQAKVTILDTDPPIWRRLLLLPSMNLAELHHVLQAAFGWLDQLSQALPDEVEHWSITTATGRSQA